MIGISILSGILTWTAISIFFSKKIMQRINIKRHKTLQAIIIFISVLSLPFWDQLIGSWQFNKLCKKEAITNLSPNWTSVRRAKNREIDIQKLTGYAIPIEKQRVELVDLDTGEVFLSINAFHTDGGILLRNGLGLNQTTSCWPPDSSETMRKIKIDQLIKQGEYK